METPPRTRSSPSRSTTRRRTSGRCSRSGSTPRAGLRCSGACPSARSPWSFGVLEDPFDLTDALVEAFHLLFDGIEMPDELRLALGALLGHGAVLRAVRDLGLRPQPGPHRSL